MSRVDGETELAWFEKRLLRRSRPDPRRDRDWRSRAACRKADPELFFQLTEASPMTTAALAYCHTCPVTGQCLRYAVGNGCWGVWGGIYRPEPGSAAGIKARREAKAS